MRRFLIITAAAAMALSLPFAISAKQFPAVSQSACAKVGGTFSQDKSSPPTKKCTVPGKTTKETRVNSVGYRVEITSVSPTTVYTKTGGGRETTTPIGGAIGVTRCWRPVPGGAFIEVIPPSSDPDCRP